MLSRADAPVVRRTSVLRLAPALLLMLAGFGAAAYLVAQRDPQAVLDAISAQGGGDGRGRDPRLVITAGVAFGLMGVAFAATALLAKTHRRTGAALQDHALFLDGSLADAETWVAALERGDPDALPPRRRDGRGRVMLRSYQGTYRPVLVMTVSWRDDSGRWQPVGTVELAGERFPAMHRAMLSDETLRPLRRRVSF